ncbi:dihydropteroate synthase [Patescibacteria group bacterium]|nr:dihydropteroate synthase [Patescibacteria group bacterium]
MQRDTKIMGILNITPDSFSDGGRFEREDLVSVAREMYEDGAEVLDIGGESTGPGSSDVSAEEEILRVVPAFLAVRDALPGVMISVDTWKSEVALAALEAGAGMINDVTAGRRDERIFEVAARMNVPVVLMYSKDNSPRTTREERDYEDVVRTVKEFLRERIRLARSYGVKEIIVDPGMGLFVSGKPEYSWEIIERISEFEELGCPILVGTSRKSFLGEDREGGTLVTSAVLRGKVDYLRVHDVLSNGTVIC